MSVDVSVVIPAYNEGERITSTLKRIKQYLDSKEFKSEILVVDDGSKDNTAEVVQKIKGVNLIKPAQNMGKGAAVKKGMLSANGKIRLFSDADLATPIEEFERLAPYLDDYEVVIASRALKESKLAIPQPLHRRIMGRVFSLIVQVLALPGIYDSQCGFKLFTEKSAKQVFSRQTIDGFAFDVESLFIARKNGFKVKEVPVTWMDQEGSKVKMIDPFKMFINVMFIRLKWLMGKYK